MSTHDDALPAALPFRPACPFAGECGIACPPDTEGYADMDSVINDITGMAFRAGFTGKTAASSAGTKREGQ